VKISRGIVSAIRAQDPPGNFLEQDHETGLWNDIGNKRAIEKTSQALREGASIRKMNSCLAARKRLSNEPSPDSETSVATTQTPFDPAWHSGFSATSFPSSSGHRVTRELSSSIGLKQHDEPDSKNYMTVHAQSSNIEMNESVDQEITNLIRETFVSNNYQKSDNAADGIVEITSDNISADCNDENPVIKQKTNVEKAISQNNINTSISPTTKCNSSDFTREGLFALLSFNTSSEKKDIAKIFKSIDAAAHKVQDNGTNSKFSTNRAA